jgi:hypothetical protein
MKVIQVNDSPLGVWMRRSPVPHPGPYVVECALVCSCDRSRFYAAEDGDWCRYGGYVTRGSGVVEFALNPSMVRVSPAATAMSY